VRFDRRLFGSIAIALSLTGCVHVNDSSRGPLTLGGEAGEMCVPGAEGQGIGFGEQLQLAGDSSATIESVALVDASGLEVLETYIAPNIDNLGVGTYSTDEGPGVPGWNERVDAVGAVVPPASDVSIATEVVRRGSIGNAAGLRVRYKVDGAEYEATGVMRYRVADACH
jgi:hypothetical protein